MIMPLDRLEAWLCSQHPYLSGITHEAVLTGVAIIALLGLVTAVRRRDRALRLMHGGLLLFFMAYPIVMAMRLRAEQYARPDAPFMAYIQASRPIYALQSLSSNVLQPLGCLLGLIGATWAVSDVHRRKGYDPRTSAGQDI